jgi:ABC-type lipoprotein export system ATPase subunit
MISYSKYNRGSEWRKWDLHIHTPISIYQNYGGERNWDKFIEALENLPKDVKVIGITDYYFIDGYEKVMQYKSVGRLDNIDKIFPILEFRIDTFGSGNENKLQKINLHILFDIEESNLTNEIKKIKNEFISQIPITRLEKHKTKMLSIENFIVEGGNDLQKGFSDLIPSTDRVFEVIKSSTWVNKTFLFLGYKEWSNLEKNNQVKPLKEDLYQRVQAFFSSNYSSITKSQSWLDEYGNKRLLHSGDIHDFEFLDTANKNGDNELLESTNYNCNTWIKADPTFEGIKQIIYEPYERIAIQENKPEEKAGYHVIDSITINKKEFWSNEIHLNPNLNTIIGGRSTGKSTLLKCIAKKIEPSTELSDKEADFIIDHLEGMEIKWQDGESSTNRDIEYFKQSHMYEIANNPHRTNKLIEGIIRHKDINNTLTAYENFCNSNRTDIVNKVGRLFQLQTEIDNQKQNLKEKGDKDGIEKEIFNLEERIKSINASSKLSKEDLANFEKTLQEITTKEQQIKLFKDDHITLNALSNRSIVDSSLEYEFNTLSNQSQIDVHTIFISLSSEINAKWKTLINNKEIEIINTVKTLSDGINNLKESDIFIRGQQHLATNKQYNVFKNKLEEERKKLNLIIETEKNIQKVEKQRDLLKNEVIDLHFKYYTEVNKLVSQFKLSHNGIDITSAYSFSISTIAEFFSERLNQRSGERQTYINNFIWKYTEDIKGYIGNFLTRALNDEIEYKGGHLNSNVTAELLSTNWFQVSYNLTYQNDIFSAMSQGKQAFVILKLLLEFSEKSCPILIDQPEDSLDNRAIYNELVKYLKEKKKERQIILVTHNPNVVVSADAEQIIVANQEGKDSPNEANMKFQYVSGALEYSKPFDESISFVLKSKGIREHVCEILEGGVDAFKKREQKYNIK